MLPCEARQPSANAQITHAILNVLTRHYDLGCLCCYSSRLVCLTPTISVADIAEEAGGQEYGEEAEEEEGLGPRQSSGLSHLEYGGEDLEANKVRKNRRQIKASGRAVGKTNRRRRLDEEDEQAEEIRATRKRKRGEMEAVTVCTCVATIQ